MKRAVVYLLSIFFLYIFLGGCATGPDIAMAAMLVSTETVEAVEFPELILTDRSGFEREVKILSVQGRLVTVAPFPYWLLDPVEIPLGQIQSLRIKRHSYPGITLTAVLAEAGFITAGGVMGILADSSETYALAIGVGILGAVAGVGSAFFSDIWELGEERYPEYDLTVMSETEKLRTILQLMGVL
ncbi:MAG: hypothetical protein JSV89_22140 [Spirochaetaceae bacterium]|nr:MAG: hypothetical protein JSV89_22140 [Spirochaetaceae bacterium]